MATGDMLLQLAGVTGESSDAKHKDFIDLVSWSWGMLSPTDVSTGQRVREGEESSDFKIVKRADRSSPVLIQYLKAEHDREDRAPDRAQGRRRRSADVLRNRVQEPPGDVVQHAHGGAWSSSRRVTFAFETATFKYTPQSATGAKGGGTVEYTVDAYALGK